MRKKQKQGPPNPFQCTESLIPSTNVVIWLNVVKDLPTNVVFLNVVKDLLFRDLRPQVVLVISIELQAQNTRSPLH